MNAITAANVLHQNECLVIMFKAITFKIAKGKCGYCDKPFHLNQIWLQTPEDHAWMEILMFQMYNIFNISSNLFQHKKYFHICLKQKIKMQILSWEICFNVHSATSHVFWKIIKIKCIWKACFMATWILLKLWDIVIKVNLVVKGELFLKVKGNNFLSQNYC